MPVAPFDGHQWKMPGYTGHINGVSEVIAKTPVHAQEGTYSPCVSHTHDKAIVPEPNSDIVNAPGEGIKCLTQIMPVHPLSHGHGTDNLWPNLATPHPMTNVHIKNARAASSIRTGDQRYSQPVSYSHQQHGMPGTAMQIGAATSVTQTTKLTSTPLHADKDGPRFKDLGTDVIRHKYEVATARVRAQGLPVETLEQNVRLRFRGKINTMTNANGFKLRFMFHIFDQDRSGVIEIEEFAMGLLHMGMQFSEEQELALFSKYDNDCSGTLSYNEFMMGVLDKEYYCMAFAGTPGYFKAGVTDA